MPEPYRPPVLRLSFITAALLAAPAPLRADTLLSTQTYTTPGAYTYTLPANTYRVVVKVWGAGGNRSSNWSSSYGGGGGTAGFVAATYGATASTVLNIRVGSAPGGASGAWVTSGFQVIGGGGGSAGESDEGEEANGGHGGTGGPTGGDGGYGKDGAGGTGSAGGAGGTSGSDSGSAGTGPLNLASYAANGGAGHNDGGGTGGSGYYGGGGGAPDENNGSSGGGGGGSNFMDTGNGYVSGTNTTGGTGDAHYSSSLKYGQGADNNLTTPGHGAVVVLVYAANQNPIAGFTPTPNVGRAPLAVSFNGSASSDPNAGGAITAYAWDFDNNGSTDATGSTANNTFQNTGTTLLTPTVKLTVTDNDTSPATANTTQTINVYPASSKALTVQSGSITANVHPYYQQGTAVSISANAPSGTALFAKWIVVSGNGTFASDTSSSTTFTVGSADTVIKATYGPTVPGSFASPSNTSSSINLSWSASTDDTAVVAYDLYRVKGGLTLFATSLSSSATSFSDTHVLTGTSYGYFLKARDGDGNFSNATSTVTVTTSAPADTDSDTLPDAFETLFGTTANANPSGEASHNLKIHRPN
jgi:hypothetical protein